MESKRPQIQVYFLMREFKRRGYTTQLFPHSNLFLVEKDGKSVFCSATKTQVQNQLGFFISENKYLTKVVLEKYGIPTSRGAKVSMNSLHRLASLVPPFVVKPLNLNGGKDVVIGLHSTDEIEKYMSEHPQHKDVLVEEMLQGDDIRVLIVRGKYFAAVKRTPAHVIGDGVSTIEQLVNTENDRRKKRTADDEAKQIYTNAVDPCLLLFDAESEKVISEQGFSRDSILQQGARLFIRKNSNISTGGTCVDCTNDICEEIREQCVAAAKALTMTFAGIDVMTNDVRSPLSMDQRTGIVEINASPGIELHILPDEGESRDPTQQMVDEVEEQFFNYV